MSDDMVLAITEICDDIKQMLIDKNRKYGNSVQNPAGIFSKSSSVEQINVRMDDKLSRIKSNQNDDEEDAETDLIGYLILKKAVKILEEDKGRLRFDEIPEASNALEEYLRINDGTITFVDVNEPIHVFTSPMTNDWSRREFYEE